MRVAAAMPIGILLQCIAVRFSALQCVAVRCSALQCVAVQVTHPSPASFETWFMSAAAAMLTFDLLHGVAVCNSVS